jgi:hypothetical protein
MDDDSKGLEGPDKENMDTSGFEKESGIPKESVSSNVLEGDGVERLPPNFHNDASVYGSSTEIDDQGPSTRTNDIFGGVRNDGVNSPAPSDDVGGLDMIDGVDMGIMQQGHLIGAGGGISTAASVSGGKVDAAAAAPLAFQHQHPPPKQQQQRSQYVGSGSAAMDGIVARANLCIQQGQHHQQTSVINQQSPTASGFVYQVFFKRSHKYFVLNHNSSHLTIQTGDYVKVEADRGEDLGVVGKLVPAERFWAIRYASSMRKMQIAAKQVLKCVIRFAYPEERNQLVVKTTDEATVTAICRQILVTTHPLPITIVDSEYQFDRKKLIIYHDCKSRVDFREFVKDLFGVFKTRIWMQQLDLSNSVRSSYGDGGSNVIMPGGAAPPPSSTMPLPIPANSVDIAGAAVSAPGSMLTAAPLPVQQYVGSDHQQDAYARPQIEATYQAMLAQSTQQHQVQQLAAAQFRRQQQDMGPPRRKGEYMQQMMRQRRYQSAGRGGSYSQGHGNGYPHDGSDLLVNGAAGVAHFSRLGSNERTAGGADYQQQYAAANAAGGAAAGGPPGVEDSVFRGVHSDDSAAAAAYDATYGVAPGLPGAPQQQEQLQDYREVNFPPRQQQPQLHQQPMSQDSRQLSGGHYRGNGF